MSTETKELIAQAGQTMARFANDNEMEPEEVARMIHGIATDARLSESERDSLAVTTIKLVDTSNYSA